MTETGASSLIIPGTNAIQTFSADGVCLLHGLTDAVFSSFNARFPVQGDKGFAEEGEGEID